MILAEPLWLHTLGQMAGTLLMLELCFVLLLVCVIVSALAYGSWWLYRNVMPILSQYGPMAQQYMGIAVQGSDRVVGGVAEFHGRWEAITTTARVMLFGTRNAGRPELPPHAPADATAIARDIAREDIPTAPAVPDVSETPAINTGTTRAGRHIGLNGHNGHAD